MTDTRLRELERAFKESNSPEDELAYLRERVRQGESLDWDSYSRLAELNVEAASEYLLARVERGDLEREKLELAAYCDHEPARVALGEGAPEVPKSLPLEILGDPRLPIERAVRWGSRVSIMAQIAAAKAVLLNWQSFRPEDNRPRDAIAAASLWLGCPCSEHRDEARVAAEAAAAASCEAAWAEAAENDHTSFNSPAGDAALAAACAAESVFLSGEEPGIVLASVGKARSLQGQGGPSLARTWVERLARATMHEAVSKSLVHWSLRPIA